MNGYEANNGDDVVKYQREQEERLTKEDINEIVEAVYEIIKPEIDEIKYEMGEIREEMRETKYEIKHEMGEIREEMRETKHEMDEIRHELNVIKRSRGTFIIVPRPSHVFHSGETDNGIEEVRNEWFRYK